MPCVCVSVGGGFGDILPQKRIGGMSVSKLFHASIPLMYLRVTLIAQAHQVVEVESKQSPCVRVVNLHERLDMMHVVRRFDDSFFLAHLAQRIVP